MKQDDISPVIREKAPLILAEIKKAKSILLHCHPSPDPDSVGSALAMKFALEQMGKKVTVIKGDSEIPKGYRSFPGVDSIISKNFSEVNLKEFDLFISLDSAEERLISRFHPPIFPLTIKSVVIDHHPTNRGYADLNLVEPSYPSVCQILFELFGIWNVTITSEIAKNLFIGLYTDSGGLKYPQTSAKTFAIASELTRIAPDFSEIISQVENTNTPGFILFEGVALSSVETFFNGRLAVSVVPYSKIKENNISTDDVRAGEIATWLRTVPEWDIVVAMIECEPGKIRLSSRTIHPEKYDISKLMSAIGGGGHKAAAAAIVNKPFEETKQLVVSKAKELYNL